MTAHVEGPLSNKRLLSFWEGETESRRRVGSLLVEGVVILVSILLAFWLEGWRADREASEELRQELVSVGRELERNRDLMAAHLTALDRVVVGGGALTSELEAHPAAATVEVTDTLAVLALDYHPSFDPSLGGDEALISSGRLAGVRDSELRLGLASLRDMMSDAREDELVAIEISTDRLAPLLAPLLDAASYRRAGLDFFDLSVAASDNSEEPGSSAIAQQERSSRKPMTTFTTGAFPNSLEIRNTLWTRLGRLMSGRGEFGRLVPYLDELLGRLRRELGQPA